MSVRSKPSVKKSDPRRPIAQAVLANARQLAEQYQVVVQLEKGHWYAHGLEMPRVFGDGVGDEGIGNMGGPRFANLQQ